MKPVIFSFLIISVSVSVASAQKFNFSDIRYTLNGVEKTVSDTTIILLNIHTLEKIDTQAIKKHDLKDYYAYLGKSYMILTYDNKSTFYRQKAFVNYSKVLFHHPHDYRALWYFSVYYANHDDCAKAKLFIDALKKYGKRKEWKRDCIADAEAQCQ